MHLHVYYKHNRMVIYSIWHHPEVLLAYTMTENLESEII